MLRFHKVLFHFGLQVVMLWLVGYTVLDPTGAMDVFTYHHKPVRDISTSPSSMRMPTPPHSIQGLHSSLLCPDIPNSLDLIQQNIKKNITVDHQSVYKCLDCSVISHQNVVLFYLVGFLIHDSGVHSRYLESLFVRIENSPDKLELYDRLIGLASPQKLDINESEFFGHVKQPLIVAQKNEDFLERHPLEFTLIRMRIDQAIMLLSRVYYAFEPYMKQLAICFSFIGVYQIVFQFLVAFDLLEYILKLVASVPFTVKQKDMRYFYATMWVWDTALRNRALPINLFGPHVKPSIDTYATRLAPYMDKMGFGCANMYIQQYLLQAFGLRGRCYWKSHNPDYDLFRLPNNYTFPHRWCNKEKSVYQQEAYYFLFTWAEPSKGY